METKGKWETIVRRLEALLRLKTFPVAISLLEDPEELAKNKWARRPIKGSTLCQAINIVRTFDWTVGFTAEEISSECGSIIGLVDFEDLPEELKNGAFRNLVWCKTKEDGRKFEHSIQRIPNKYKAVILAPLVYSASDPDLILVYANPAQMILIINALQFEDYERLQFFCVGEGSCSDAIAGCYLTRKPSLTIPCYGERRYGHAQDDELVMGLLPEHLEKVERNLEQLYMRGITYPIPFSGAQVDISSSMPLSYQAFGEGVSIEGFEVPLRKITRW